MMGFGKIGFVRTFIPEYGKCIDPMHKWRRFEQSFVYIEISATSLVFELNFQKKMLLKMRLVGLI